MGTPEKERIERELAKIKAAKVETARVLTQVRETVNAIAAAMTALLRESQERDGPGA